MLYSPYTVMCRDHTTGGAVTRLDLSLVHSSLQNLHFHRVKISRTLPAGIVIRDPCFAVNNR